VDPHLQLDTSPVANPDNVIAGDTWRITVLTAGLVRLEHSPTGQFEDRASQMALHRATPPVEFTVLDHHLLEVHTDRLHLVYDRGPFTPHGLSVQVKGGITSYHSTWRPGAEVDNLGGTARTLDLVDGRVELEPGPLSHHGIAVLDDSTTLLLDDDGWVAPRAPDSRDLYVFAYGLDHDRALAAYHDLTGPQPLVPRYALGNWWSRYHEYTAQSYLDLLDRFDDEGLPFAVAVLDMDWHLVDIPPELGSGWTGYTWNTDLFPDPPGFLQALHDRGMAITLNVHPADGVRRHEAVYPAIAERMDVDPASGLPVAFDPSDPEFIAAYLEELHHPLEEDGVDFWWIDWQQGGVSAIPGLDPLWVLNHFHWLDSGRDRARPLTFSRYAGLGSHRYPVGFSGDTVTSWASLEFQPEFTATAANVGFGWWSHDIGGHFEGTGDPELALRWLQFGVFSPIMRLHSGKDPFNRKEPWAFAEPARGIMRRFLRLRHQLVPYLATMAHRAHHEHRSLVAPMYHDHPQVEAAYHVPNQYTFGTEVIVAPITEPVDDVARVGAAPAWLPPGTWVDLFTGTAYRGDRRLRLHRPLGSIPVLARAGAILPLVARDRVSSSTDVPDALEVWVVAGADGAFELVEDRDDDRWATTTFTWDQDRGELVVEPVTGVVESTPPERDLTLVLLGCNLVTRVRVTIDGDHRDAEVVTDPDDPPTATRHHLGPVARGTRVRVEVQGDPARAGNDVVGTTFDLLDRAAVPLPDKNEMHEMVRTAPAADAVAQLQAMQPDPVLLAALTELLLAD
jgi:alpha-glucosidase (family GH31 glycosyl hydrolase)